MFSISMAQVSPGATITTNLTLTGNLDASAYAGSALKIGADNITIDGAGYTITVNGNNTAFELYNHHHVIIKNVNVVSSVAGQGYGIRLQNANFNKITGNTFTNLVTGIYTSGTNSNDTLASNSITNSSGTAFESYVHNCNNVDWIITGNTVTGGSGWGIQYQGR
ncbi:MAG: NosD domain-containing protein, partial [Fidelibacterota bacterium]